MLQAKALRTIVTKVSALACRISFQKSELRSLWYLERHPYVQAQERLGAPYRAQCARAQAILNVASSGRSSSGRTIAEYAAETWKVELCPIP